MKKNVLLIFISFVLFLSGAFFVLASTCNTYGNSTYCSDGTTYNTYGNTTYGSDGTTYNTYGNTTYVSGPNGYSGTANTYGGTTYYNGTGGDNYTANTYGNTTYINGSNGTNGTINTYGNTSYGTGNVYSSCPTNSYSSGSSCKCNYGYVVSGSSCVSGDIVCHSELGYGSSYIDSSNKCECDYGYVIGRSGQCVTTSSYCSSQLGLMSQYNSLSKKCECMSNYEYNGSSCVYKSSNYSNTGTYPAYSPTTSNCPLNSNESITDATKCTCNIGYQTNSAKDACVKIPTPIKTNEQLCQDSFGLNVLYNGTTNSDGTVNCNCKSGYQWNTGKTSCVIVPIIPVTPVAEINQGSTRIDNVVETPILKDFEVKDSDITILNSIGVLKNPATFRKCPSTECSVIRYYAETSKLKITGSTLSDDWYRVEGTTDAGGSGQSITGWIYASLFETLVPQEVATTTAIKNENKQGWFTRFINWFR